MGYSALVGLGVSDINIPYTFRILTAALSSKVLIIGAPLQFILVKAMFTQRKKGVKITDQRIRIITEVNTHPERSVTDTYILTCFFVIQVLQGIRLIKFYAWEWFYTHRIGTLRTREIQTVRKMA